MSWSGFANRTRQRRASARRLGSCVEPLEGRVVLSVGVAPLVAAMESHAGQATLVAANPAAGDTTLVNLTVQPIDLNLLGLEVKSGPIAVTLTAQRGQGQLLGNVLGSATGDRQLARLSDAADQMLGQVISLVNGGALGVAGVDTGGDLGNAAVGAVPAITLTVAPTHVNALGVQLDVSPFQLTVTAHSGQGLVLGNALAAVANLFNPPLPDTVQLNDLNARLAQVLGELNAQAPGIAPAALAPSAAMGQPTLNAAVPGLNLNLLGLTLQTTPISLDTAVGSGPGQLLGNVLTTLQNTQGAVPGQLAAVFANLNAIVAKVVGVLNASTLTLPAGAVGSLPPVLRALAGRSFFPAAPGATLPILDLGGGAAPGSASLLGLQVAGTNVEATLSASPGDGQILGNLLYNAANIASPVAAGDLARLLGGLAGGGSSQQAAPTELLTFNLPSLDLSLLGLEVQSSPINVTVSADSGRGEVLGNVLASVAGFLQARGTSRRLNLGTGATAALANSASLSVAGVDASGPLGTASAASVPVLALTVPATHVDLLGARVDVAPVQLNFTAHAGPGLVLGNALAAMSNLFNPPLPSTLQLDPVNAGVQNILAALNAAAPGIAPAATLPAGAQPLSAVSIPGLNLNLLGLIFQTDPVAISTGAQSGSGLVLGNVLATLTNTAGQTPQQQAALYGNVTAVLAKVVGVLNASTLTLPATFLSSLPASLRPLLVPNLITPNPASAPILSLGGAVTGSIDSFGEQFTDSGATLRLAAQTGDGQVLGNLLYNLVNLS